MKALVKYASGEGNVDIREVEELVAETTRLSSRLRIAEFAEPTSTFFTIRFAIIPRSFSGMSFLEPWWRWAATSTTTPP